MSIINDFKNEFRFSAHGRTSRRNFWIYQIGLFVLGLAVAMGCGTIIGLTNAVVGFWFIIAAHPSLRHRQHLRYDPSSA